MWVVEWKSKWGWMSQSCVATSSERWQAANDGMSERTVSYQEGTADVFVTYLGELVIEEWLSGNDSERQSCCLWDFSLGGR